MNSLRLQQEETQAKYEELQGKIKTLEQENLAKEQEITSLSHKNQLLETEVEKLEAGIKEAKAAAEESGQHGTQNEALQRRLQLLEEEAEESDKTIRETNEKYEQDLASLLALEKHQTNVLFPAGYAKQTSRLATTNAKSRLSRQAVTSGKRSTERCPRNTTRSRRNWTTSRLRSGISERLEYCTWALHLSVAAVL